MTGVTNMTFGVCGPMKHEKNQVASDPLDDMGAGCTSVNPI